MSGRSNGAVAPKSSSLLFVRRGAAGCLRGLALAGCAIAGLTLFGGQAAWASAGCNALNGTYGPSNVATGNNNGTSFNAGDVITITFAANASTMATLWDNTASMTLLWHPGGLGTSSYTVPATNTHKIELYLSGPVDGTTVVSWSCVSAPDPTTNNTNTDSRKLASLQQSVTPLVANTSAQAIAGAIDGAINDAFGNGGTPFSGSANGFTVNFAAEPQPRVAAGADEAFGALAYAGKNGDMPIKAPPLSPKLDKEWSVWADVRGTGWKDNDATTGFKGRQLNVTAGIGRKITSNWLLGVVGGYESFSYDVASLTGTLKGHGGTIGGYTGYKLLPTLRWDAALALSRVNYDGTAGTASGSFNANRWIASTGLTGTYRVSAFIIEPSSKIFALWEKQNAYTDSLGTLQAGRAFSAGRVSTGGTVIYPWQLNNGWSLAPYAGLYGDWRFGSNTTSSGDAIIGLSNGWSARVVGGVSLARIGGGTLALGGEYGGLGANYKIWTGNARVNWAF